GHDSIQLHRPAIVHGMVFDNIKLPQAACLELRQAWDLEVYDVSIGANVTVDTVKSPRPITPWVVYASSKGSNFATDGLKRVKIHDIHAAAHHQYSFFQFDSPGVPVEGIKAWNLFGSGFAFGMYINIDGDYDIEAVLTDCGYNGSSGAIHKGTGT